MLVNTAQPSLRNSLHPASQTSQSWPRWRPHPIRGRCVVTLTNRRLSIRSRDQLCAVCSAANPLVWTQWWLQSGDRSRSLSLTRVSDKTGARSVATTNSSVGDTLEPKQPGLLPNSDQCKSFSWSRWDLATKGWECCQSFTHISLLKASSTKICQTYFLIFPALHEQVSERQRFRTSIFQTYVNVISRKWSKFLWGKHGILWTGTGKCDLWQSWNIPHVLITSLDTINLHLIFCSKLSNIFEIITSSIFQINKHLFDILSLLSAIDVDLTKK